MKQIMDIPVIYDAEVIFKGGRKRRMVKMFSMVPFEVDTQDAEMVARFSHGKNPDFALFYKTPDGYVKTFGDMDLQSSIKCDFEQLNEHEALMEFKTKKADAFIVPNLYKTNIQRAEITFHHTYAISEDTALKSLISDTKQKSIADMKKFLDGMTLINGALCRKMDQVPKLFLSWQLSSNFYTEEYEIDDGKIYDEHDYTRISAIPLPVYSLDYINTLLEQSPYNLRGDITDEQCFADFNIHETYKAILKDMIAKWRQTRKEMDNGYFNLDDVLNKWEYMKPDDIDKETIEQIKRINDKCFSDDVNIDDIKEACRVLNVSPEIPIDILEKIQEHHDQLSASKTLSLK